LICVPSMGWTSPAESLSRGKLKSQIINGEEYPPFTMTRTDNKEEFKGLPHQLTNEFVPKAEFSSRKKQKLFAMVEVERANVQIGYVMLNVLGLREHNRLCDLLAKIIQLGTTNACSKPREIFCSLRFWELWWRTMSTTLLPYHFKFFTDPLTFSNEKWS